MNFWGFFIAPTLSKMLSDSECSCCRGSDWRTT